MRVSNEARFNSSKKIKAPFVPGAVDAALKLAESRKPKNRHGLAGWFLTDEWGKVKAQLRKGRARASAVALIPPGPLQGVIDLPQAVEEWRRLQSIKPFEAGELDHLDAVRQAQGRVVELVERSLGKALDEDRAKLLESMATSGLLENTPVWRMSWKARWSALVLKAAGLG